MESNHFISKFMIQRSKPLKKLSFLRISADEGLNSPTVVSKNAEKRKFY